MLGNVTFLFVCFLVNEKKKKINSEMFPKVLNYMAYSA